MNNDSLCSSIRCIGILQLCFLNAGRTGQRMHIRVSALYCKGQATHLLVVLGVDDEVVAGRELQKGEAREVERDERRRAVGAAGRQQLPR